MIAALGTKGTSKISPGPDTPWPAGLEERLVLNSNLQLQ